MVDLNQKLYCPACYESNSVRQYMEGDYLRYLCLRCGWKNEKTDFYKIVSEKTD